MTTETAPWILWTDGESHELLEAYTIGVLSSLVLDWWARRFVEGHVDQEAFDSLRVPRLSADDQLASTVISLGARLAAADDRFRSWAEAVGVDFGSLTDDEKDDMIHELDAAVAHLYGLSEAHLVHIFETFHEGWDYQDRLDATLRHYQRLKQLV